MLCKIVVLGAAAIAGCSADPSSRPTSFTYIHAAIIAPSCATSSCHSSLAQTAGVVLDDKDTAYRILTDPARNYVLAGDPGSTLILLLEGDERTRMPPEAPLPADDIDLIRTWIIDGAAK